MDAHITVLVLAAGKGTRMGERPKLLLPMRDGLPVLRHAVLDALRWEPLELIVVVRPDLPELIEALADLPIRCVPNPRFEEGMGSSLAVGIGAVGEEAEAALVTLGDQPHVSPTIIEKLVAAYRAEGKPVTVPRYGEEIGPPTLFSRALFPQLAQLRGDTGGRQIIRSHPRFVCTVPFNQGERPSDLDTPEDYMRMTRG